MRASGAGYRCNAYEAATEATWLVGAESRATSVDGAAGWARVAFSARHCRTATYGDEVGR